MQVLTSLVNGEQEATRVGSRELSVDSLIGTRKRFEITFIVGPSPGQSAGADYSEEDALAAAGVPVLRDLANNAYCIGKIAKEIDSINSLWVVVASYDSQIENAQATVDWGWTSRSIEKVIQRDPVSGNPIVNSVGEPLLTTAPISIPILTVERIVPSFSPTTILAFENKTNSITFYGAPPGCALCTSLDDSSVPIGGIIMRRVRAIVEFDLSIDFDTGIMYGWAVQLLNHGTKYKVPPTIILTPGGNQVIPSGYVQFVDMFKNPTTGNLNLDGSARDPSLPPLYLPFNRHSRANLNLLNLGPF